MLYLNVSYHSEGIGKNKAIKKQRQFPIPLMNKSIERDEVLKPCLDLCKKLQISGYLLQYRRLDVFDKTHIEGSPDIEIWVSHKGYIFILMCECKKPVGGVVSDVQSDYRDKYKEFINTTYEIITDPKQLDYLVKKLFDKTLPEAWQEEVNQHMGLEPLIEKGTDI